VIPVGIPPAGTLSAFGFLRISALSDARIRYGCAV